MSLNQEANENRCSDHPETPDSIQLAQTTHNPSTYSDRYYIEDKLYITP